MQDARLRWPTAALAGLLFLANPASALEDEHAVRLYRESRAYAKRIGIP